ncbi:MAG: hypothetical protein Q4Q07_10640 [Tissierellia bacterium]|nr:hypothetical protein [Tissierellia bacterium]
MKLKRNLAILSIILLSLILIPKNVFASDITQVETDLEETLSVSEVVEDLETESPKEIIENEELDPNADEEISEDNANVESENEIMEEITSFDNDQKALEEASEESSSEEAVSKGDVVAENSKDSAEENALETETLNEDQVDQEEQVESTDDEILKTSENEIDDNLLEPESSDETLEVLDKDKDSSNSNEEKSEEIVPSKSENKNDNSDYHIYLDGVKGTDENDGTSEIKAVKTFDKAKSLLEELLKNLNNNESIKTYITVVGTTEVSGKMTLKDTQAKVKRGKSFNNYLFKVKSGQELTLEDIIIDGNTEENMNIEKSLIQLDNGSTLNIKEGTVLTNNKIKDIVNTATKGGAIYSNRGTINMTGGTISNNAAVNGGGIYLNKSKLNMTGGIIEGNEAKRLIDTSVSPTQIHGTGGGILADEGSTVELSGNAQIKNNSSAEVGGGISIGSRQWSDAANILYMNGGIIDGNSAGASGGGIFIGANFFNKPANKAYINEGQITNNKMTGKGSTYKAFGGGGIYVNGVSPSYHGGVNGELHLKNVIVTDNKSAEEGAGYAACPISNTKIYVTDGGAIYDNKTNKNAKDIYILSSPSYGTHSGNPEYDISKRMLGGKLYNWKKADGTLLEDDKHVGKLKYFETLQLYTDEEANELTHKLAKVKISGNYSATKGGGIGSNGDVKIGTKTPKKELEIKKEWINVEPEEIQLVIGATVDGEAFDFETVTLNEANEFKVKLTDLPALIDLQDLEDILYFREIATGDYEFKVSKITNIGKTVEINDNGEEYEILSFAVTATNENKPEEQEEP